MKRRIVVGPGAKRLGTGIVAVLVLAAVALLATGDSRGATAPVEAKTAQQQTSVTGAQLRAQLTALLSQADTIDTMTKNGYPQQASITTAAVQSAGDPTSRITAARARLATVSDDDLDKYAAAVAPAMNKLQAALNASQDLLAGSQITLGRSPAQAGAAAANAATATHPTIPICDWTPTPTPVPTPRVGIGKQMPACSDVTPTPNKDLRFTGMSAGADHNASAQKVRTCNNGGLGQDDPHPSQRITLNGLKLGDEVGDAANEAVKDIASVVAAGLVDALTQTLAALPIPGTAALLEAGTAAIHAAELIVDMVSFAVHEALHAANIGYATYYNIVYACFNAQYVARLQLDHDQILAGLDIAVNGLTDIQNALIGVNAATTPDLVVPLAPVEMPLSPNDSSVAASLDTLKTHLQDMLARQQAAGQSVFQAQGEMQLADQYVQQKQYKTAYEHYKNAYQMLGEK